MELNRTYRRNERFYTPFCNCSLLVPSTINTAQREPVAEKQRGEEMPEETRERSRFHVGLNRFVSDRDRGGDYNSQKKSTGAKEAGQSWILTATS